MEHFDYQEFGSIEIRTKDGNFDYAQGLFNVTDKFLIIIEGSIWHYYNLQYVDYFKINTMAEE